MRYRFVQATARCPARTLSGLASELLYSPGMLCFVNFADDILCGTQSASYTPGMRFQSCAVHSTVSHTCTGIPRSRAESSIETIQPRG